MKKNWLYLFLTATAFCMASCSDNDDPQQPVNPEPEPEPEATTGAYVINTGNWNANNGSIMWYDMESGKAGNDLYEAANGRGIGDVQDLCVYGQKMYAICTTSAKVSVLDLKGKLIKELLLANAEGQPINPRYAVAHEGAVFFTAQDGTVSRLDTVSLDINAKVEVGPFPEAITEADGKLFVNISDMGKGHSVAVVDPQTMTKVKDIEVKLNPYTQAITGEDGYVYVVSNGNYAGDPKKDPSTWIYQTLQRIDPKTYEVKEMGNATYIANWGDKMYILYAEYYLPDTHCCKVLDLKTGKEEELLPLDELKKIANPGFIEADPVNGDFYIASQVYGELNEVYVFSADGKKKSQFTTGNYTTGLRFQTK